MRLVGRPLLSALAGAMMFVGCRFEPGFIVGDASGGGGDDDDGSMMTGSDGSGSSCTEHTLPPSKNVDASQWSAAFLTAPAWTCTSAGTTTFDTTTGTVVSTNCDLGDPLVETSVTQTTGGSSVTVIVLSGLTLAGNHHLNVIGTRPAVFLVAGDVSVEGGAVIDASAARVIPGPGGSRLGECTSQATGLGGLPTGSGWGGGGGGFGTEGGVGGLDVENGGATTGTTTLEPLRGGCSGSIGGSATGAGAGGGAVEISASGTITIGSTGTGIIAAAGGGAPGSNGAGGGNGGGSGGAILLVAATMPTLGPMSALRTHGGAGSEGCSSCSGLDAGDDGHISNDDRAKDASGTAGGGNGNDHGRRGGLYSIIGGGTPITGDGEMTSQQSGGRGGGGGGGGRILVTAGTTTTACD